MTPRVSFGRALLPATALLVCAASGAFALAPAASPAPAAAQASTQGPRAVPLREALRLTAQESPDVIAARAQAAIAEASVRRAWTAWQPDIVATGTFDHTSAPASFNSGDFLTGVGQVYGLTPKFPINSAPVTIVAPNSRYGTLQISQPFFSPQGLFLPGAASASAEAAKLASEEAREQALLATARTYLSLQSLDGLLVAAKDAEQVALRREQDARAQIAAGTAVEVSLLRAQSETAQARVQMANLEGQKASLLPLLEALVGEPVQPGTSVDSGLPGPSPESANPWQGSFQLRAAQAQVDAIRKTVRYDHFQWLPTLAGIAKGNYNSNSGFAGQTTSYDLILNLSVPLYDRGTRYAALHEDQAKLAQAQAQLVAAQSKSRAGWLGARANLIAAQAVLEQAQAQAQLAQRTQAQVEAAAKAGVSTSLDLSDADAKRLAADSALVQSKALLEIRKAELAVAEGRLSANLQ